MRTHEEFCAEISARKNKIIKRRKERRRVVLACVPFVVCIAIFMSVGLNGNILFPETPDVGESVGLPETVMETVGREEQTVLGGVIEIVPPAEMPDDEGIDIVPPADIPSEEETVANGAWDEEEWIEMPEGEATMEECDTQVELESESSSFESGTGVTETEALSSETGIA